MKQYIELTIILNAEINLYFMWSKLYTQLHLSLVEMQDENGQVPIGVSFPEYKMGENKGKKFMLLGSKLRIFAKDEATLARLNLHKWLVRLEDYVHIKNTKQVPENVQSHLIVNRYRPRPNAELIARRYSKRHDISLEEALERLKGYEQKWEPLPYIQLKSLSGKQEFSLCVSQKTVDTEKEGMFSTYGLSSQTTVPHW